MAMATKEQELKALARIKKIVEDLGEGSYIGMAFEGCFEIAEDNIGNDFGCSMKQRAEKAESELKKATERIEALETGLELAKVETERLKARTLTTAEAAKINEYLHTEVELKALRTIDSSAVRIVEFAENPGGNDFREAVQNNRMAKKRLTDCQELTRRLNEILS